ncbi:hypothetical protein B0O44_1032 [Pedobacter nutrimenti]|uniref:Uncharacterized protein n=1 Tax=Pedobacter nutrimenti TaxID=1241337 RepID=A0A318UGS7_9SPHI|nr:hypothetical protein B0O44_1032 [Pedobacter nutrimenti]
MDLSIIPECYVDTNLVETLVPPSKGGYNHQKGCGTVTSVMKGKFSDSFAVGIIDKDKKQVDYLNEFNLVHQFENLFLHKHKDRHHYIIQINPALERFLISGADEVNISLEDYGLPIDMDRLKKISKSVNSKEDPRFKKLIRATLKAGSPAFITLAKWITYLKDKNYAVNIEELKVL